MLLVVAAGNVIDLQVRVVVRELGHVVIVAQTSDLQLFGGLQNALEMIYMNAKRNIKKHVT